MIVGIVDNTQIRWPDTRSQELQQNIKLPVRDRLRTTSIDVVGKWALLIQTPVKKSLVSSHWAPHELQ